jgi:TctA family transporter
MLVLLKCIAADLAIVVSAVAVTWIGVIIRRMYSVPQNPYDLLWVFIIITVVGFALVAHAGIRVSSGAWSMIAIVACSVVGWVAAFYAISIVWINSYGT